VYWKENWKGDVGRGCVSASMVIFCGLTWNSCALKPVRILFKNVAVPGMSKADQADVVLALILKKLLV
jgi:hypothetical protein